MAIQYLETLISLPPGLPSPEMVHELLRLMFEKFRWFPLVRYGTAAFDERMAPGPINYRALLDFYEERKVLCAAARTDRDLRPRAPHPSHSSPRAGAPRAAPSLNPRRPAARHIYTPGKPRSPAPLARGARHGF